MQILIQENYKRNKFPETQWKESHLILPSITTDQMELINEWVNRKTHYKFQIAGQKIDLWPAVNFNRSRESSKLLVYRLETVSTSLKIKIEERLFQSMLSKVNEINFDQLDLQDTAILVEYFFTELLNKFEATFSTIVDIVFDSTQDEEVTLQSIPVPVTLNNKPDLYCIWLESTDSDLKYWLDIIKSIPKSNSNSSSIDHLKIIPLNMLLGIVELELKQVASLERGDIILLEGLEVNHFQISAGSHIIWPAIRANNAVELIGSASPNPIMISSMNKEVSSVSIEMKENSPFDEIPVVLAFEVGRKDVSVQELKSFSEGTIVQFPEVDQANIKILANGAKIGEGSLVQVGDSIGIKINRIYSND